MLKTQEMMFDFAPDESCQRPTLIARQRELVQDAGQAEIDSRYAVVKRLV
jgi:hypothetical protein